MLSPKLRERRAVYQNYERRKTREAPSCIGDAWSNLVCGARAGHQLSTLIVSIPFRAVFLTLTFVAASVTVDFSVLTNCR